MQAVPQDSSPKEHGHTIGFLRPLKNAFIDSTLFTGTQNHKK